MRSPRAKTHACAARARPRTKSEKKNLSAGTTTTKRPERRGGARYTAAPALHTYAYNKIKRWSGVSSPTFSRERCQKRRAGGPEGRESGQPDPARVADPVGEPRPGDSVLRPPGAFQRLHELVRGSRGVNPDPSAGEKRPPDVVVENGRFRSNLSKKTANCTYIFSTHVSRF